MKITKKCLQRIVDSYLSDGTVCPKCGIKMWYKGKPLILDEERNKCHFAKTRKTCPRCKTKLKKVESPTVRYNHSVKSFGFADTKQNKIFINSKIPLDEICGVCLDVTPNIKSPFCIPSNLSEGEQYICVVLHEIYHFIFDYPVNISKLTKEYGMPFKCHTDVSEAIKNTNEGKLHLRLHNLIISVGLKEFNKTRSRWKQLCNGMEK